MDLRRDIGRILEMAENKAFIDIEVEYLQIDFNGPCSFVYRHTSIRESIRIFLASSFFSSPGCLPEKILMQEAPKSKASLTPFLIALIAFFLSLGSKSLILSLFVNSWAGSRSRLPCGRSPGTSAPHSLPLTSFIHPTSDGRP